jgi:transcriptional regulator with XRE-family HTH domain
MFIGQHIRGIRESKKLTQRDLEKRTGLVRTYLSRVEHGHVTPSVETLEKIARGLGVPIYQLFYDTENLSDIRASSAWTSSSLTGWGSSGKDARLLAEFRDCLSRMDDRDRRLITHLANWFARKKRRKFGRRRK